MWVRLPGSSDKNVWTDADTNLPAQLRAALQTADSDWQPLAERLRKQRLDPLAPHLTGVRKLIVLPSTALAGVPVEVIADGYTVSYAHSSTMYAHLLRQPTPISKGLLVLADPVFDMPTDKEKAQRFHDGDEGKWERLPGTRIEAASLQRLFDKQAPVQLLLDSDASEQRLDDLAQRGDLGMYRYIHLATHGQVNDNLPLRSAVILSRDHLPDEKRRTDLLLSGQPIPDGRLEAEEALARWNLHCDLVTLSACQTALGKYERGEGFVGFAQGLILCGTRSVCLSLWKVDDVATALLMDRFYQNLLGKRRELEKPMAKAAALAEAKMWLRTLSRDEAMKRAASLTEGVSRGKGAEKLPPLQVPAAETKSKADNRPFDHPYYWAAFVLVGQTD
jgi:CHAT domain-containing protein